MVAVLLIGANGFRLLIARFQYRPGKTLAGRLSLQPGQYLARQAPVAERGPYIHSFDFNRIGRLRSVAPAAGWLLVEVGEDDVAACVYFVEGVEILLGIRVANPKLFVQFFDQKLKVFVIKRNVFQDGFRSHGMGVSQM